MTIDEMIENIRVLEISDDLLERLDQALKEQIKNDLLALKESLKESLMEFRMESLMEFRMESLMEFLKIGELVEIDEITPEQAQNISKHKAYSIKPEQAENMIKDIKNIINIAFGVEPYESNISYKKKIIKDIKDIRDKYLKIQETLPDKLFIAFIKFCGGVLGGLIGFGIGFGIGAVAGGGITAPIVGAIGAYLAGAAGIVDAERVGKHVLFKQKANKLQLNLFNFSTTAKAIVEQKNRLDRLGI